jgi:hypothetical protein
VAVAVPPSVALACEVDTPPSEVPKAEEVASVPPVELVAEAVVEPPPSALPSLAEVPGPEVLASPMLAPTTPAECELELASVLPEALCALAAVPTDVPLDSADEVPPSLVLAAVSLESVPDSLRELAALPPLPACEDALLPSAAALDSALESAPVDPAPAPAPPPSGPDLPAPAAAVSLLPPYALAPAPVSPSPTLSPACAGAPPVLLPYAPPMPTAPWS